jgi:hypothetical protein
LRAKRLALLVPFLAGLALPASADEGMWMPQQIPLLARKLRELGFSGDAKTFADLTGQPMGAIVSLGGCSASFVSPEGLIVTNHHCVTGALQYNSKPESNLLRDGYLARTRADELWNGPGSRVVITTRVTEVTDDLHRRLTAGLSDHERQKVVERWQKERTAACEASGSRCRIASFFGGLEWYEIEQLEIRDVRLVWAPPSGIGNFGGETDNWRWPRHVGDFGIYRAYVGPDGKPASYAASNVPYHPKRWLRISSKGVAPGDLVIVAGYPAGTRRHRTYAEIDSLASWELPRSIRRAEEQLGLVDELARGNTDLEIKLEQRKRGLANGLTLNRGVLEGLVRDGVLERKKRQERELDAWIVDDAARSKEFGGALSDLAALVAAEAQTRERDAAFDAITSGRGGVLPSAITIYELALERPKADLDREPEYQERNWVRIREGQERLQRSLDPAIERVFLRYQLDEVRRLPETQRIEALDRAVGLRPGMSAADAQRLIESYLDRLLAGTRLFDQTFRMSLLDKSVDDLRATGDTMLELAAALEPLHVQLREVDEEREGARLRIVPRYMEALRTKAGGLVAPDANGTLRVTYGRVAGVDAADGLTYRPQTTLAGILEKHTGEGEFAAPDRELEAIRALRGGRSSRYVDADLGDVPVDFLSTVDTTGGNSGSATLDAQGNLCGLLFDGTYDSVVADILYDGTKRSIHVDSRYLLWVLSEVEGAATLLDELGHGARAAKR